MIHSASQGFRVPDVPLKTSEHPVLEDTGPAEEPSYDELKLENRRLKAELEEAKAQRSPIRLDPDTDRLVVEDLTTPEYHVDRLEVSSPELGSLMDQSLSLDSFLAGGKLALPSLEQLKDAPLQVEMFKLRVPESTLNQTATRVSGEALQENGLKDVKIGVGDGGTLTFSGQVDRFIDIPFEVSGRLGVTDDGKVRFDLQDSHVFGILPLPKLMVRLAASMTGGSMEKIGLTQEGNSFFFDVQGLLPDNLKMQLQRISSQDGQLVLEGGAPPAQAPPEPEHNPTVLVEMGPWGPRAGEG